MATEAKLRPNSTMAIGLMNSTAMIKYDIIIATDVLRKTTEQKSAKVDVVTEVNNTTMT